MVGSFGETYVLGKSLVDVEGDGDLDIFLSQAKGMDELWLNNGRARFSTAPTGALPSLSKNRFGARSADVDGDGDEDLFAYGPGMALLLNDGKGTFTEASSGALPSASTSTTPKDARFVDIDNDGDFDLIAHMDSPHSFDLLELWRNDGTGRFTLDPSALTPIAVRPTGHFALGDVDGDGDSDLVVSLGNAPSSRESLLLNDGTGIFKRTIAITSSSTSFPSRVLLTDMDQDGDLDLLIQRSSPYLGRNRDEIYLYDHVGHFRVAQPHRRWSDTAGSIAADFDGDGDEDLINAYGLHRNRHRQLSTRFVARTGARFAIDVSVRPGYGTAPALSAAWISLQRLAHPVDLAGMGPLRIDVTNAAALPIMIIHSPQGETSYEFLMPRDPSLAGQSIYCQGVTFSSVDPARLTGMTTDLFAQ